MTSFDIALSISQKWHFIKRNFIVEKQFHGRYLFYRVARPILKVNYKIFKAMHPLRPWTSQASISIFEALLKKDMTGFEYGSGNSTVFFARHLGQFTSVEHHEQWFKIVKQKLEHLNIVNVDYHFIPPKPDTTSNVSFKDFPSVPPDFKIRNDYQDYFSFITRFPINHFDFILIDGRARVECAMMAIPRLKPGGIFVLDNSDRSRYEPIFRQLKDWKMINTTTGLFDTTLWFKPQAS